MTTWEYDVVPMDGFAYSDKAIRNLLDGQGMVGWEFVFCLPPPLPSSSVYRFVFKRQRQ